MGLFRDWQMRQFLQDTGAGDGYGLWHLPQWDCSRKLLLSPELKAENNVFSIFFCLVPCPSLVVLCLSIFSPGLRGGDLVCFSFMIKIIGNLNFGARACSGFMSYLRLLPAYYPPQSCSVWMTKEQKMYLHGLLVSPGVLCRREAASLW